jgi:hypothetical protein
MLPFECKKRNPKLVMSKTLSQWEAAIERIKCELMDLGPMRPGSLSRQYRDPKTKNRPFHQISYTHKGHGKSEYVRAENLAQIRRETANFKRCRKLVEQWVELSLKTSQLRVRNTGNQSR